MKYKLFFAILIFCSLSNFAQEAKDRVFYLDSLHNPTTETNYSFKRIVKDYFSEKDLYEIFEYYKSGGIFAIEISSNKNEVIPVGMCKHFYENGNIKSIHNYSKLVSANKQFEWYESGQKKSEIETSFDSNDLRYTTRILQFWDEKGNHKIVDGNGEWETDNNYENEKGNLTNGNKNGIWKGRNKKHNLTYSEKYKDGVLIYGRSIDSLNLSHYYTKAYQKAEPKKGNRHFNMSFIDQFPTRFKRADEPSDFVEFTISTEGKIININTDAIKREKDKKIAIKFLSKYGDWNPAIYKGIAIPSSYGVGIPYRKSSQSETIADSK